MKEEVYSRPSRQISRLLSWPGLFSSSGRSPHKDERDVWRLFSPPDPSANRLTNERLEGGPDGGKETSLIRELQFFPFIIQLSYM